MYSQFVLVLMVISDTQACQTEELAWKVLKRQFGETQGHHKNPLLDKLFGNQFEKTFHAERIGTDSAVFYVNNDGQDIHVLVIGSPFEWTVESLDKMITQYFPALLKSCGSNFAGLKLSYSKSQLEEYRLTTNHHTLVFMAFGVHLVQPPGGVQCKLEEMFGITASSKAEIYTTRWRLILLNKASVEATRLADSEEGDGLPKKLTLNGTTDCDQYGTRYLYITNIPMTDVAMLSIEMIQTLMDCQFKRNVEEAMASKLKAVACTFGRKWFPTEKVAYPGTFETTNYVHVVVAYIPGSTGDHHERIPKYCSGDLKPTDTETVQSLPDADLNGPSSSTSTQTRTNPRIQRTTAYTKMLGSKKSCQGGDGTNIEPAKVPVNLSYDNDQLPAEPLETGKSLGLGSNPQFPPATVDALLPKSGVNNEPRRILRQIIPNQGQRSRYRSLVHPIAKN